MSCLESDGKMKQGQAGDRQSEELAGVQGPCRYQERVQLAEIDTLERMSSRGMRPVDADCVGGAIAGVTGIQGCIWLQSQVQEVYVP